MTNPRQPVTSDGTTNFRLAPVPISELNGAGNDSTQYLKSNGSGGVTTGVPSGGSGGVPSQEVFDYSLVLRAAGCADPDGSVWACSTNVLVHLSSTGVVLSNTNLVPYLNGSIVSMCIGSDGYLYVAGTFTAGGYTGLAKVNRTTLDVTLYEATTGAVSIVNVINGADGNVWYADEGDCATTAFIGKFDIVAHTFTDYALTTAANSPAGLALGADSCVWYLCEEKSSGYIYYGKVATDGTVTEYSVQYLKTAGSVNCGAICADAMNIYIGAAGVTGGDYIANRVYLLTITPATGAIAVTTGLNAGATTPYYISGYIFATSDGIYIPMLNSTTTGAAVLRFTPATRKLSTIYSGVYGNIGTVGNSKYGFLDVDRNLFVGVGSNGYPPVPTTALLKINVSH